VWLGSVVHRALADWPVLWVQMDFAHQFNGDWPAVCRAEKRPRSCGYEFNTTVVYHNKRTRKVHAHVAGEAGAHVPPQPALKCAASAEWRYLNHHMANFAEYVRRERRPSGSGPRAAQAQPPLPPPVGFSTSATHAKRGSVSVGK